MDRLDAVLPQAVSISLIRMEARLFLASVVQPFVTQSLCLFNCYTPKIVVLNDPKGFPVHSKEFNALLGQIAGAGAQYSLAGTINLVNLPIVDDQDLGQVNGPGDVATAFAWDVANTSQTFASMSVAENLLVAILSREESSGLLTVIERPHADEIASRLVEVGMAHAADMPCSASSA